MVNRARQVDNETEDSSAGERSEESAPLGDQETTNSHESAQDINRSESPREFIRRRMRELDREKPHNP